MCGIAGILTAPGKQAPHRALDVITDRINHRGPDGRGAFQDDDAGVHLGHTRLAIVDLSPGGAQPMVSQSERYVIVLNGEIYNYKDLRKQLDDEVSITWRGSSDTEVLLAACETWGLEIALSRLDGMFAFGLWDRKERELGLARDRFGEKPLYVGETNEGIVFSSQLGSILDYPGFVGIDDHDATDMFLALSYIPEPRTPFTNVWKVPAASFVRLTAGTRRAEPIPYWSAPQAALDARENAVRTRASETEIAAQIEERLSKVIGNQMLADVPLGAFLSGGIDSSLVVAMMQKQSDRPVKTFTIGFKDAAYDEAPYARAVAKHLGTDHTEVMLDWSEALSLVEKLPETYDEPFADSSQLPTRLVSAIARKSVTVCLSGDGGDEVFGGYNRHLLATRYERVRDGVPSFLRAPVGHALTAVAQPRLAGLITALGKIAGENRVRLASEKLNKIGGALRSDGDLGLYLSLVRRDEGLVKTKALEQLFGRTYAQISGDGHPLAELMMMLDTLTYLPGDILAKVDRAAMSVALETRVPYLDHHLFSLAWSLPISEKIKGGQTKSVLRNILAKHVPSELFERPKAGFGVPIESWLKGPLRGWAEANLAAFQQSNPRHAATVQEARDAFYAGKGHLHHFLWNVLMLQAWRRRYQDAFRAHAA
ncbi:asparagine synthase (glutamine-hydrolyzing) [Devosia psychrophila]|uniref:asparagine synthase (glutamine-hydrolyzing) n=1 Tax=Devosia psychrophila TaxID=728005 RepID=A0A0F5Q123_9HYPH|nr:asparagine synthase (glutamine-hydrolyzing) [Devosia psychrophila]KKC34560.1 hypothetical protein WH91_02185 [Devosia psychrophila]SFD35276.1 asparagine synthase (glutamine-hydrolysing) [Devosia psychrophila]